MTTRITQIDGQTEKLTTLFVFTAILVGVSAWRFRKQLN